MGEVVMTAASVRPAGTADRSAVEELLRSAGLPVEGVADQFEDGYVVAESADGIVGVAGLEV
jgi:hypothetical protein